MSRYNTSTQGDSPFFDSDGFWYVPYQLQVHMKNVVRRVCRRPPPRGPRSARLCGDHLPQIRPGHMSCLFHSVTRQLDLWRNGSASDSRSEGCVFESRWVHFLTFCFFVGLLRVQNIEVKRRIQKTAFCLSFYASERAGELVKCIKHIAPCPSIASDI